MLSSTTNLKTNYEDPGVLATLSRRSGDVVLRDGTTIAELDCNPFVVTQHGGVILDARVRVTAVEPRPLLGVRR